MISTIESLTEICKHDIHDYMVSLTLDEFIWKIGIKKLVIFPTGNHIPIHVMLEPNDYKAMEKDFSQNFGWYRKMQKWSISFDFVLFLFVQIELTIAVFTRSGNSRFELLCVRSDSVIWPH